MKFAEINSYADEQLVHHEMALERTLMGHLIRHRLGKLENTSVLKKVRSDIARTQTAITGREHLAGLNKGALRSKYSSSFVPSVAVPADATESGAGFLQGVLDSEQPAE